jgi:hypothetical protein
VETFENRVLLSAPTPAVSLSLDGEYAVLTTGNSALTLASISQNGTALTFSGSTSATGTLTSPNQFTIGAAVETFANSSITFAAGGSFAGQIWTKLDLPTDFTNQQGAPTHASQYGSSVTLTDKYGHSANATWTTPTQLSIPAWHDSVTFGNGLMKFSDGFTWNAHALPLTDFESKNYKSDGANDITSLDFFRLD